MRTGLQLTCHIPLVRRAFVRRHWALGLAAGLASISLGLTSASAQPPSTLTTAPSQPPLISVASARSAALAIWPQWQTALATADDPAIRSLSVPGPMQESFVLACGDKGYVLYRSCQPSHLLGVAVIVPEQAHYPLYFLAQFRTAGKVTYVSSSSEVSSAGKYLELVVLTKQNPTSHWRVALDTGFSNPHVNTTPSFVTFTPDSNGLDSPSVAKSPVPVDQLPVLLAHYLQSCKDDGVPPRGTLYLSVDYDAAYQACLLVAKTRQGATVAKGTRLRAYWAAYPPAGLWGFGIDPSGQTRRYALNPFFMACFTVVVANVYTPVPPYGVLAQQPDRANWGPALASGLYSEIVDSSLHSSCVTTDGTHLSVIGYTLPRDYAETGTEVAPFPVVPTTAVPALARTQRAPESPARFSLLK